MVKIVVQHHVALLDPCMRRKGVHSYADDQIDGVPLMPQSFGQTDRQRKASVMRREESVCCEMSGQDRGKGFVLTAFDRSVCACALANTLDRFAQRAEFQLDQSSSIAEQRFGYRPRRGLRKGGVDS
ncbi:hypothetical protein GCM10008023_35840 [Sphingomonas glacialis]|uniref:Uncharacterized protein n=1 Tax=Sphingomonas glacialis TaxID=658225 RepID=A0ABQ3LRV7_9SPHN|nr:hypothetical protein GCM10008023_35840 [Sphingomonas glacialis]